MKVSICFMTMDRYDFTKRTLERNLFNHGFIGDIELLWCDNGSKDHRIFDLAKKFEPHHFRDNKINEGCAKGFNQLMLRSTGDYIVLMGNDVLMPPDWLNEMVKYANHVPNSGFIGIKCSAPIPPMSYKFGCHGHFLNDEINRVFGVTLFRREIFEKLGGFNEEFGNYGLEDSEFNIRVNLAGYNSLYVPSTFFKSEHIGEDVGQDTEYRKMKWDEIAKNDPIFNRLIPEYVAGTKSVFLTKPEMRDPL